MPLVTTHFSKETKTEIRLTMEELHAILCERFSLERHLTEITLDGADILAASEGLYIYNLKREALDA